MERFQNDFHYGFCVGNWSINEYEKVKPGDRYYMIRCGNGKTGIVMQGKIESKCYESSDWSPKRRKKIFYADINYWIMVNPEIAPNILTPEILSQHLPDFNWFGGHSGRRLSKEYEKKLDELWSNYINSNPVMFHRSEAIINSYHSDEYSPFFRKYLKRIIPQKCEICGYDYKNYFNKEIIKQNKLANDLQPLFDSQERFFHSICKSCNKLPDGDLIEILEPKDLD